MAETHHYTPPPRKPEPKWHTVVTVMVLIFLLVMLAWLAALQQATVAP